MSKLFVLFLLAALLIPVGVFAACPDTPSGAINATAGTCIPGMGNTPAFGMMNTGADEGSCGSGSACDCDDDCSCGMMGGSKGTAIASCCGGTGVNRTSGISSCGITRGASGCGMLTSGTASQSCSNSSACDCDEGFSCGMTWGSQGTAAASCGSIMTFGETACTTSTPMMGMMGGAWGQSTAGGAGRSGWIALGFILVIVLIIIWIVVGILLILNLYRKLSTK